MIQQLVELCRDVRRDVVRSIYLAQSGHPGSSLSTVEILVTLYFGGILRCFPEEPKNPLRDRFVLSKGHAAPTYYSVLAHKGFFDVPLLDTLRKLGSPLQGHPNPGMLPCLDCAAGSLGQGLSVANGMALAFKYRHESPRVYCLIGDGEQQEGQVWEAAMFAAQHRLDNVCLIVDCNRMQLVDAIDGIKSLAPMKPKWESFGWHVTEADGHDIASLQDAFRHAAAYKGKPSVILAHTVKGKGVSYMENQADWHGTAPDTALYEQAMRELGVEI